MDKIPNMPECQSCAIRYAAKEVNLLYDIANLINSSSDTKSVIEKVMHKLKQYSYLGRCAFFVANEDDLSLELFASIDLSPQQKMIATYKFGEGATGLAAQSKEPVVIENIHNNINYLNKLGAKDTSTISYVAVPLMDENRIMGVISANLTNKTEVGFDDIVRILTIAGSLCAKALKVTKEFESEKKSINELKEYYQHELQSEHQYENIIGKSSKMQQIFQILETIAPTDATVLIRGETGTGKELIATAIHNRSNRKHGPLIKLNCAAISESLLESELFGHEKGAFTDAKESRKGRFELADKGTLFLDEIGDISASLQVKLLRILQEQEFERVGGSKTIKVDVRLVAATNRNLEKMVSDGTFREDLFYRLNVIPINLPPLRERYEDVKLLIEHFMSNYMKIYKKKMTLSKNALEILLDYPWPGNIRELQNMMERIVLICPEGDIQPEMLNHVLPFNYQKLHNIPAEKSEETAPTPVEVETPQDVIANASSKLLTKKELEEVEKASIIEALNKCNGNQTKAAEELGITPRQIGYKMKKYKITL